MKQKWYETSKGIVILLFIFSPVGLYLMWKHANWNKAVKWVITGIFLLTLFSLFSSKNSEGTTTQPKQQTQEQTATNEPTQTNVTNTPEPTKAPVKATNTTAPTKAPVKAVNTVAPIQTKQSAPASSSETTSQKNAVRSAKSYLNYTAFSHDGLVAQLEYGKFSHADAVYGADNSGGNWNEQAAKSAKQYMEYSAFSRGSLIDQLKYSKFTQEQAEYGANAVGL
jgi:type IV secretory pathway VirB10-like protein